MSARARRTFRAQAYYCSFPGCSKTSSVSWGIQQHYAQKHFVPTALRSTQHQSFQNITPTPTPSPPPPSSPPWSNSYSPRQSPRRLPTGSPISSPREPSPFQKGNRVEIHPIIDGLPCDPDGYELPSNTHPPQPPSHNKNDFTPFSSRTEFEMAEFLFVQTEMAAGKVDRLMQLLAAQYPNEDPPFANHDDLYACIDSIQQGDIPWSSFSVTYNGKLPESGPVPEWMTQKFEVWFRDPLHVLEQQIGNPAYVGHIDYAPKRVYRNGKRRYQNLMSGQWAWKQADKIAKDIKCHGAMFCPVILGSDKTTVSVATGQNDFYPLYISLGNVHNKTRRAHKNAVTLLGFLAIPKTSQEFDDKADFRKFRRQLFHTSLEHILSSLRPYMSTPRVTLCGDGHYRPIIYGIGPYIADYPEQALLACVVQGWCPKCTSHSDNLDAPNPWRSHEHTAALMEGCSLEELWDDYGIVGDLYPFTLSFPRADIHELLAPDLLHQIIKGTFKDHLVDWITQYINQHNEPSEAKKILADIDKRIAVAPPFPGLRHFHQGRGFKQWTGNDSKGLMKVYLPAIIGHVPDTMVQAVADFLDFCYLVRRNVIDDNTLDQIEAALLRFHQHREIFRDLNVRPDGFSLPRQHSLCHYSALIRLFGAPNGLCSSITENKHIKAVKKPYRRSSRNKPLGQMLIINQRIDKMAAARVFFSKHGMLSGSGLANTAVGDPPPPEPPPTIPGRSQDSDECGELDDPESQSEITLAKCYVRKVPRTIGAFSRHVGQPRLPELTQRFLYEQLNHGVADALPSSQVPLESLPSLENCTFRLFTSARAVYYAPSDLSGENGLYYEMIRSTPSWHKGPARRDCVFLGNSDSDQDGFAGLHVARVFLFFSFTYGATTYPCALIQWFSHIGHAPCPITGMWMVKPDFERRDQLHGHRRKLSVVHLDSLYRGAHLIGNSGKDFLPRDSKFDFSKSLDSFRSFYVNKYIDHHAHEIAF